MKYKDQTVKSKCNIFLIKSIGPYTHKKNFTKEVWSFPSKNVKTRVFSHQGSWQCIEGWTFTVNQALVHSHLPISWEESQRHSKVMLSLQNHINGSLNNMPGQEVSCTWLFRSPSVYMLWQDSVGSKVQVEEGHLERVHFIRRGNRIPDVCILYLCKVPRGYQS